MMRPLFCLLMALSLGACGTVSSPDKEGLQPRVEQHMRVSAAIPPITDDISPVAQVPQCEMFLSSIAMAEQKSNHALLVPHAL